MDSGGTNEPANAANGYDESTVNQMNNMNNFKNFGM